MARRTLGEIKAEDFSVLKNRIIDLFSAARTFKSSHAQIMVNLNDRIYSDRKYQRLNQYHKGYLAGIIDREYDRIWHEHLTFQHYLTDEQIYVDAFAFKGPYRRPDGTLRLDESKNRHVWKGTERIY